jgi:hypothetical protein
VREKAVAGTYRVRQRTAERWLDEEREVTNVERAVGRRRTRWGLRPMERVVAVAGRRDRQNVRQRQTPNPASGRLVAGLHPSDDGVRRYVQRVVVVVRRLGNGRYCVWLRFVVVMVMAAGSVVVTVRGKDLGRVDVRVVGVPGMLVTAVGMAEGR